MPILAISDLALALLVGGATALGAGVGGVISAMIALAVEKRRQRFHGELESEERRKAARVAARLISEELFEAKAVFFQALNHGEWGLIRMSTEQWTQHRTALAAVLTDDDWTKLMDAVSTIQLFADEMRPESLTGQPLVEAHRGYAQDCHDKLGAATKVLKSHASGSVSSPATTTATMV
jgi:hypothetical protein